MARKPPHERAAELNAIAARRERVAELALRKWTQARIARELGVSQATVAGDLKAARKLWQESAVASVAALVAQELAAIAEAEREAWWAWEESKKATETVTTERSHDEMPGVDGSAGLEKVRAAMRRDPARPDLRALDTVLKCSDRRSKLLGLDAPEKLEVEDRRQPRDLGDNSDLATLPDEELLKLAGWTDEEARAKFDAQEQEREAARQRQAEEARRAREALRVPAGPDLPLVPDAAGPDETPPDLPPRRSRLHDMGLLG